MDLRSVDSLDRYLEDRRVAECSYFNQYSKWRRRWDEEHFDDLGLPRFDIEPVARLEELIEMLGLFARNCMTAYAKRVGTGGPLEILDRLDGHREALLREVLIRKWVPATRRLQTVIEARELEEGWRQVEGVIEEFLWERLQPLMWRENKRWAGGLPVVLEFLADEDEAARRRNAVGAFLQRCRSAFPDRKFTEAQISEAAGYSDTTLFKAWKSNKAKSTESSAQRFEELITRSPENFVALIDNPPKFRRTRSVK